MNCLTNSQSFFEASPAQCECQSLSVSYAVMISFSRIPVLREILTESGEVFPVDDDEVRTEPFSFFDELELLNTLDGDGDQHLVQRRGEG